MDTDRWEDVPDRGPHAAGLLTMPVFLAKYASRRARGAAVYTAFLCKSFTADHVDLKPSTEPNLMVREGCSTCHATLEPLAAYFSRVEETSWVFLPQQQFPVENPVCKKNAQGKMPGFCDFFYDAAFSDAKAGKLRGAYALGGSRRARPRGHRRRRHRAARVRLVRGGAGRLLVPRPAGARRRRRSSSSRCAAPSSRAATACARWSARWCDRARTSRPTTTAPALAPRRRRREERTPRSWRALALALAAGCARARGGAARRPPRRCPSAAAWPRTRRPSRTAASCRPRPTCAPTSSSSAGSRRSRCSGAPAAPTAPRSSTPGTTTSRRSASPTTASTCRAAPRPTR